MPAASWRIMPARSISRCETISASFGFSFRMGRKNRDNRMARLGNRGKRRSPSLKPDQIAKHKGRRPLMPASCELHFRARVAVFPVYLTGRLGGHRALRAETLHGKGQVDLSGLFEFERHRHLV